MPHSVRTDASQNSGLAGSGLADRPNKRKSVLSTIEVDLTAPEPPSKKARRALKKLEKLTNPATEAEGTAPAPSTTAAPEDQGAKVRSEHGVWFGNLPFQTTPEELKKWLVDNSGGVILESSISRIKLPRTKDATARDKNVAAPNKGFAYVDFTKLEFKVAALALSESWLGGRNLLIKDAQSFEGRPAKPETDPGDNTVGMTNGKAAAKDAQTAKANRKIFVGNLAFQTTEDDVHNHFEKCGEISWVKVATFEDTGKCKGYGWVKFAEPGAAASAVQGFVKIKEANHGELLSTVHDTSTKDDSLQEGGKDGDDPVPNVSKNRTSVRKWWVNKMWGRNLKIQHAQDDQQRQQARFSKDQGKQAVGRRTAPLFVEAKVGEEDATETETA